MKAILALMTVFALLIGCGLGCIATGGEDGLVGKINLSISGLLIFGSLASTVLLETL